MCELLDLFDAPADVEPIRHSKDVTEAGPGRFYMVPITDDPDRHQLVDRTSGSVIEVGSWLNVWGLALRRNGHIREGAV